MRPLSIRNQLGGAILSAGRQLPASGAARWCAPCHWAAIGKLLAGFCKGNGKRLASGWQARPERELASVRERGCN